MFLKEITLALIRLGRKKLQGDDRLSCRAFGCVNVPNELHVTRIMKIKRDESKFLVSDFVTATPCRAEAKRRWWPHRKVHSRESPYTLYIVDNQRLKSLHASLHFLENRYIIDGQRFKSLH